MKGRACSLLLLLVHGIKVAITVTVTTTSGPVRGTRAEILLGIGKHGAKEVKEVFTFLGVPYAEEPLGENMFERPKPFVNHKNLSVVNNPHFHACPQPEFGGIAEKDTSLDCLYLSIYSPAKERIEDPLKRNPVLVFIPGENFLTGSARQSEAEKDPNANGYIQNYVTRDITVVVVQFRLGIQGYASDNTAELPGNYALWDLTLSLEWIRENIVNFGGDRDRITLWGAGSSAAAISLLSVAKPSRNLFHRTIQIGGGMFCPWVINDELKAHTEAAAKRVETQELVGSSAGINKPDRKCGGKTGLPLKNCFKSVTEKEFKKEIKRHKFVGDFYFSPYHPHYDGIFFDETLEKLLESAPAKPAIVSFGKDDGLLLSNTLSTSWQVKTEDIAAYDSEDLKNFIATKINPKLEENQSFDIMAFRDTVYDFYLKNDRRLIAFERLNNLLSDVMFIYPIVKEARMKARRDWNVYLYQMSWAEEAPFLNSFYDAVPHLSEVKHMKEKVRILKGTDTYECVGNYFVESFVFFAETGCPRYDNLSWTCMSNQDSCEGSQQKLLKYTRLDNFYIQNHEAIRVGRLKDCDKRLEARVALWDELSTKFNLSRVHGMTIVENTEEVSRNLTSSTPKYGIDRSVEAFSGEVESVASRIQRLLKGPNKGRK